jgi:16S rRNA (cytidine1402-2'-O)-methyltransferase
LQNFHRKIDEVFLSVSTSLGAGTLYIVSTPIGNLEDISVRALRTLSEVDLIAAEDTRTTGNLLHHYNIKKPLLSYHNYNESQRTPRIIDELKQGRSVALVSEAGTPGISDPSYRVIRAALDEQLPVVAIPGPTAFLSALITSGLSSERFVFLGFLPQKKGRMSKLEEIKKETRTLILYESPHRILRTLTDLRQALGDRRSSISRELTKRFEETRRGYLSDQLEHFQRHSPRGEFVIVVEGFISSRFPVR